MLPKPFDILSDRLDDRCSVPRGGTAFLQGDPARGPFFVVSGMVELVRHTRDGQRVTMFRAMRGDTLAEASIFSDQYHCDCVATRDSDLICISKAVITGRMAVDPDFVAALLRRLAGQVQYYRRRLEINAIRSAEHRILAALSEFGQPDTILSFSQSVGLTHEATYRALASLVRQGRLIRTGRGRYQLAKAIDPAETAIDPTGASAY